MMVDAARHERLVQLFVQPTDDARFGLTFVVKVDDVSTNQSQKPGAQRFALGVGRASELLRQFLGTNERAHGAPHQLRHFVGRVKLGNRSSVSAHPV